MFTVSFYYMLTSSSFGMSLKKKDEAGVVVKDQNLPSVKADVDMFKHCIKPKTVSIIGAPMTFGQVR